jgi:effector-binding domain-containing protein
MTDVATRTPEFVHMRMQHTAVVRGDGVPVGEMIPFLDNAFTVLRAAVDAAAIAPDGPQFSRYDSELVGDVRLEGGIPLLAELTTPIEIGGLTIEPGELPGGVCARSSHVGPSSELADVWQEFLAGLRAAGREPRKPYWETYHVTPSPHSDPNSLRTDLCAVVA